jgi:ureidoacrylate peracid hydrolase
VQPREGELVLVKHRYSAFIGTGFDLLLRRRGIFTLVLTGGGTHACVEATARDGSMLDFNIVTTSDCTFTSLIDEHVSSLKRIERLCGPVVESKDVVAAWSRVASPTG